MRILEKQLIIASMATIYTNPTPTFRISLLEPSKNYFRDLHIKNVEDNKKHMELERLYRQKRALETKMEDIAIQKKVNMDEIAKFRLLNII